MSTSSSSAAVQGFAAADMLLRGGFPSEITMISDDVTRPYDRTLLTKEYLDGRFNDAHLPLSNCDLFFAGRRSTDAADESRAD